MWDCKKKVGNCRSYSDSRAFCGVTDTDRDRSRGFSISLISAIELRRLLNGLAVSRVGDATGVLFGILGWTKKALRRNCDCRDVSITDTIAFLDVI